MRQRYRFVVVGYVVMPEHIHLLISEPEKGTTSTVMQVLKQRFAWQVLKQIRRWQSSEQLGLLEEEEHVWQRRFYDFNVWSQEKRRSTEAHGEAALHAPQSGEARPCARAPAMAVEQSSLVRDGRGRDGKAERLAGGGTGNSYRRMTAPSHPGPPFRKKRERVGHPPIRMLGARGKGCATRLAESKASRWDCFSDPSTRSSGTQTAGSSDAFNLSFIGVCVNEMSG